MSIKYPVQEYFNIDFLNFKETVSDIYESSEIVTPMKFGGKFSDELSLKNEETDYSTRNSSKYHNR